MRKLTAGFIILLHKFKVEYIDKNELRKFVLGVILSSLPSIMCKGQIIRCVAICIHFMPSVMQETIAKYVQNLSGDPHTDFALS